MTGPNTAVARNIARGAALPDPYQDDSPMPTSTELARSREGGGGAVAYALRSRVAEILQDDQARAQIVPLLPKGVTFEEVILEVHRAATREPKILQCTAPSIIMAVGTAVQTGLVIGKTIHLVPVNTKVGNGYEQRLNAWTDYKGDIELVVRAGAARLVDAQAIYEGDVFEHMAGTHPYIKHQPTLDPKKRGGIIGAYAVAWINGSGSIKKVCVLTLADIEKVRKGSKQWGPDKVKECPDWYAQKTAIHRVCKTLPKSERLANVLALFEAQEAADLGADGDETLDPSMRIAAPDSVASDFATSSDAAKQEMPTPDAQWEPAVAAPVEPTHSKAWRFPLPFGEKAGLLGKPIGELDPKDLANARKWAEGKGTYPEFIAAVDELLEERRFAEEDAAA